MKKHKTNWKKHHKITIHCFTQYCKSIYQIPKSTIKRSRGFTGSNVETRRTVLWGRFTNTWINSRFIVRQRRLVDSRWFSSTYKTQLRVQIRAYICVESYINVYHIYIMNMDSIPGCVYTAIIIQSRTSLSPQ